MALFLCAIIGRRQIKAKLLIISMLAGIAQTIGILVIHPFRVYEIICYVLICPIMSYFSIRSERKQPIWKEIMIMYCVFFLLGGFLQWSNHANSSFGILMLSLTCAGILFAMLFEYLTRVFQTRKQIYDVLLVYHSRKVRLKAYYDTGNNLREPFFHRPVHITDKESVSSILDIYDKPLSKIPFATISGSDMMDTLVLDRMVLDSGEGIIEIKQPVIGIQEQIQLQQKCKMLLNAEVLNEKT